MGDTAGAGDPPDRSSAGAVDSPAPRRRPRGLAVCVQDGRFDRVHYALVLAAGAAAVDRPVTLFFTGRALRALTPGGWRTLEGDPDAEEAALIARGAAGIETLWHAVAALDVRLIACEMGLRVAGLDAAALDPSLEIEVAGVVTYLAAADADDAMTLAL